MRILFPILCVCLLTVVFFCNISTSSKYDILSGAKENEATMFLRKYISHIILDNSQLSKPVVQFEKKTADIVRVNLRFDIKDSIRVKDWKLIIQPVFYPDFNWSPHLTPDTNHIIAQHVFRSPALIVSDKKKTLSIIPDLDLVAKIPAVQWYMDVDAITNDLALGISAYAVKEHVLFTKDSVQIIPPGTFELGFYVIGSDDKVSLSDPWRKTLAFLWQKWGHELYKKGEPVKGNIDPYLKHTYNWAFDSWKNAVWQQFKINGKTVGAPVFIVNVTQSPNYPGKINEREFRSVWNQAWFSSLRSASGVFRYARRTNNNELLQKAIMTKELALAFPQQDGLFSSVIATPMETIEVNGEKLNRSTGWDHYYFGNSNRNPAKTWGNAANAPYHILDMSWTAYLMLCWYNELEKDERLIQYATRYADRLISLQDTEGFFPGWIDTKTLKPLGVLDQSPETSMSATFLLKLYSLTKTEKYKESALKAIHAVQKNIIPIGRWEDFETYWSCSRIFDSLVNKKITRNNMYKQNTLSIYWTAEALYNAYAITGDKKYLADGQRTLDEMLMFQASWQPPFIAIPALGGFGVMNADGEWNDSRQSLFAELILQYGKELKNEEYIERGIAALKASFVMMYCPENPLTKIQWEQKYPFFNEKDYGFMMENYGHGGASDNKGLGIGEFTIYDWGNGAAAEAYNRVLDHFGAELLKSR